MMKILVAADISPTTLRMCEFLQNYIKDLNQSNLEIMILHVYEPELDYSEDAPTLNWKPVPTSEHELRQIFEPLATIGNLSYVIVNEGIGDSILSRADQMDLIVMGRRRRGQIQEMMTGSLSQFVLHRSSCPVLIVPEPTARQLTQKILQTTEQPVPSISAESFARLKIMIAVAQADGTIAPQEQQWLALSLQQKALPDGMTWDRLLVEPIDLETELAQIHDPTQQELTYYAAYLLAQTDQDCQIQEQCMADRMVDRMVDRIAAAFQLKSEKIEQLNALVDQRYRLEMGGKVKPILDLEQRSNMVDQKILHYASATAALGAFPSPLLSFYTQSAALGLQTLLIAEIAGVSGEADFAVQPFFETMVGSLGLISAWLMALDVAKRVPKVGTSLGSIDAFTATWAMGKVTKTYFDSGKMLSQTELKQMFKKIRKAAEETYDQYEVEILAFQHHNTAQIKSLTESLRSGKSTSENYQKRIQQVLLMNQQPQLSLD
jgi:nucleotide-binding universal stress UspA family protein/uncharacterized protein (DUF697 family)